MRHGEEAGRRTEWFIEMVYKARPIDTSRIQLEEKLAELTEKLAQNTHDVWAQGRMAEGWRYGPRRDDAKKEHPNLVPYRELAEHEKEYDRRTALETIRVLLALGYHIERAAMKGTALAGGAGATEAEVAASIARNLPLRDLIGIWNARDETVWAGSEELFGQLAEKILKAGEPLLAYDVANHGIAQFPKSVRLRQLLALALARSGASDTASTVLLQLYAEGHDDEETIGLLARTYKDLAETTTDAQARIAYLHCAKQFYEQGYRLTGGYWSGVNAATLAMVLGERETGMKLAAEVRGLCLTELKRVEEAGKDTYWVLATLGEIALILGEAGMAEDWYARASEVGAKRYGDLNSSRRNARMLMAHLDVDAQRIEACFHVPAVVVFTGHMVDQEGRAAPRFPALLEAKVSEAIRERLAALDAAFGYSSAACGSDILFQEAMAERDSETHVVLPFEKDEFKDHSVERVAGWAERFDRVMERAADLVIASSQRVKSSGVFYDYANRLLYGLAAARAKQLDTKLEALSVWDGKSGDGPGGTASAVEMWRAAGAKVNVIDVGRMGSRTELGGEIRAEETRADATDVDAEFAPEIRALLFADAVGFSKLSETEVPLFVEHFLGLVGQLLQEAPASVLMKNTWGDGLYLVFADVRSAGEFALELRDRVKATKWAQKGLRELDLRIGLHAGPIYPCIDPVTGRPTYVGAHVSRAARIEPITPPGNVYASQPFAALANAERNLAFRCDYVGQTAMAKQYGTFPTYVVRRSEG
jgi:class 3 adenylate cyclase